MTNFYEKIPATIDPNCTTDEALDKMRMELVRSLLVVNQYGNFLGIISSRILGDHYVLEYMSQHGLKKRDEVTFDKLKSGVINF